MGVSELFLFSDCQPKALIFAILSKTCTIPRCFVDCCHAVGEAAKKQRTVEKDITF